MKEEFVIFQTFLWSNGQNFVKTFEDLIVEFDIPISDRRKYHSLINGVYLDWFQNSKKKKKKKKKKHSGKCL